MPKLAIVPFFEGPDRGEGGIRRVVEAQNKYLPALGWSITRNLEDADIIATHAGNLIDIPATKPFVSHCHGLYWYGYDWERWALKMNRDVIRSMRRADVVTAPSEWVAQAIRRGSQLDPVVLYHGVDLADFEPAGTFNTGDYVLWNKTRIDPICDPRPVLEFAKLNPQQRFVSTYTWPYEETPPNLETTGTVAHDAAREWVRHAAVYLCTSRETFGIGTIEAMAYGVPVLAFDWGGQREIVRHGIDGYLAKVDDYDDLKRGLDWCLEHRADAGFKARRNVEDNFTWDLAIARYDVLYRALLDQFQRPSPRVSVVIPAYNMSKYLTESVLSVLGQDYNDYEIVIVDDASTDDTGTIADEFAAAAKPHGRISVVHNETNQYLSEALNTGIHASCGRYILPLDADNLLASGSLRTLATELDRDRDTDIAYGAMSVIEVAENDREWTSSWPKQFEYRRQMIHQNQLPSTSMYRRKVWERVGGYRRRCRTAEDADFWCRATSFGAAARKVTDAVVLRYRNRADSMSHVEADWPWHEWYPWHADTSLTPWLAPVDHEREDPVIPPFETPLVSVIIPVGPGHERLVLDALDSLNAQTFRWWEAIVIDDTGLPDGIADLPSWCRVIRTTGGTGAGSSRNSGMGYIRGRFFIFLDADDYFQPKALELMATACAQVGGFIYSDWIKQESGEVYFAPDWDGCDAVLHKLPWPVTCMYPRSVADVARFDYKLPAWEDWDFAIQVVKAGYCGTRIPVPLFQYRIESGSRREAGFANRDSLKEEISERYRDYISGDKVMPCGCSNGGGLPELPPLDLTVQGSSNPLIAAPAIEGVAPEDMILIEFTDVIPAPLTYTGKVTGNHYRFGSDDDNRVRWVYRRDADSFLTRGEFRLYNTVDVGARLAAAGPPR